MCPLKTFKKDNSNITTKKKRDSCSIITKEIGSALYKSAKHFLLKKAA